MDKKQNVKDRILAQIGSKKKGFMTPERKKKLRVLLVKEASKLIQKEQQEKFEKRKKKVEERCGKPKPLDGLSDGKSI